MGEIVNQRIRRHGKTGPKTDPNRHDPYPTRHPKWVTRTESYLPRKSSLSIPSLDWYRRLPFVWGERERTKDRSCYWCRKDRCS